MFQTSTCSDSSYHKIGGWLLLYAIGLVLYPVKLAISLVTELVPVYAHENWARLTTPGTVGYDPLWRPVLISELVGNCCFLIFSICLIVFFFQRRHVVPRLVIIFLLSNLVFVGVDFFLTYFYLLRADSLSMEAVINMVRTAVASIIWIPYFIVSKRVKATFVKT